MTDQQLSRKRSSYVNATSRYRNALWWNDQPECPERHRNSAEIKTLRLKAEEAKARYLAAVRAMWQSAMTSGDTFSVQRFQATEQAILLGVWE